MMAALAWRWLIGRGSPTQEPAKIAALNDGSARYGGNVQA
jgi:hypothetical protein